MFILQSKINHLKLHIKEQQIYSQAAHM